MCKLGRSGFLGLAVHFAKELGLVGGGGLSRIQIVPVENNNLEALGTKI